MTKRIVRDGAMNGFIDIFESIKHPYTLTVLGQLPDGKEIRLLQYNNRWMYERLEMHPDTDSHDVIQSYSFGEEQKDWQVFVKLP